MVSQSYNDISSRFYAKELESARTTRSLTHLAVVDGFEKHKRTRGFRIGIDARSVLLDLMCSFLFKLFDTVSGSFTLKCNKFVR
jgi:hypothetical protein